MYARIEIRKLTIWETWPMKWNSLSSIVDDGCKNITKYSPENDGRKIDICRFGKLGKNSTFLWEFCLINW